MCRKNHCTIRQRCRARKKQGEEEEVETPQHTGQMPTARVNLGQEDLLDHQAQWVLKAIKGPVVSLENQEAWVHLDLEVRRVHLVYLAKTGMMVVMVIPVQKVL